MKSILLPIDQSEQMPAVLEAARLLANQFEATIEGVALRPAFAEIVAPDPIVAVTIPPADWNETEFCRSVRQSFDAFAAMYPAGGARFRWRGGSAIDDSALGSLGRVYDVTVLGRPGGRGARMTALEAALFDSGRPVLVAPPAATKTFGENVLIHWNASTETARCLLFAMPILRKAQRVSVVAVEGAIVPGPSIERCGGIPCDQRHHGYGEDRDGARLAGGRDCPCRSRVDGRRLADQGCLHAKPAAADDFWRATSHILSAAELPVFFAH